MRRYYTKVFKRVAKAGKLKIKENYGATETYNIPDVSFLNDVL